MKKAFAIACSMLLALVVAAASIGLAVAADMPYYKAPPPPVGKGKAPIIGKGKGKAPVVVSRY
jgi:hypothetical protein